MRISITCPNCHHDFSAPENLAGRRAKCPDCGTGVRVVDNGLTSDSGETSTRSGRTRRSRGGSPKGLIVVGVIAALVAGAAGLNHLQGLLQVAPAPAQQPATAANSAPAAASSSTPSGTRPAQDSVTPETSGIEATPPAEVAVAESWEDVPALADEPENLKPKSADGTQSRNVARTREEAIEEFDSDRGRTLLARMKKMAIVRVTASELSENPGDATGDDSPKYQTTPEGVRGALVPKVVGSPQNGGIRESRPRAIGSPRNGNDGYGKGGSRRAKKSDDEEDEEDPVWKRLVERCKSTLRVTGVSPTTDAPDRKSAVLSIALTSSPKEDDDDDLMVWSISAELVCADLSEDPTRPEYARVWKAEQELGTLSQEAFDDGKLSKSVNDGLNEFFISLRAARVRAEKAMNEAHEADSDSNEADD